MKNFTVNGFARRSHFFGMMFLAALILPVITVSQPYSNPTAVDLLTAGNFRILAGTTVTIGTGNTVTGDVGVSPGTSITNNGTVNGTTHLNDASAIQAQSDLITAYNDVAGRTVNETVGSELGSTTLGRGVYTSASGTFAITGTLTLNGSASDIFIFKMATTLTTATSSSVLLTGGALASNIFWQVGSSATIEGDFKGNILALTAITQNSSSTINGRALARNSFVTVNGTSVLPVEITLFTATATRTDVNLHWSTATEVNNYGFEVERTVISHQSSVISWNKAGFVEGNGTTNAPKEYSFTDNTLASGKYSYRLKQIDRDGKFEYSKSVEVTIGQAVKEFALLQNYPNPFNPSTRIQYSLAEAGQVSLKIYNALGHEVATMVNGHQEAGDYSVPFTTNKGGLNLASGIYFYRLEAGSFMSTKKLTLMK